MAKEDKVEPKASVEQGLSMLIEMETNELRAILSMRNSLTDICVNKKETLVLFGKMAGLDTSLLESLKVK